LEIINPFLLPTSILQGTLRSYIITPASKDQSLQPQPPVLWIPFSRTSFNPQSFSSDLHHTCFKPLFSYPSFICLLPLILTIFKPMLLTLLLIAFKLKA